MAVASTPGGEHERPARRVERPRRRLGDDHDLEGRPAEALQDVETGRQGAGPTAEQPRSSTIAGTRSRAAGAA
jgi:hypothetical protein